MTTTQTQYDGDVLGRHGAHYVLVRQASPGRTAAVHAIYQEYDGTAYEVGTIEERPEGWVAYVDYGTTLKRVPMVAAESIDAAFRYGARHYPYAPSDAAKATARAAEAAYLKEVDRDS